ncbi:hypothetical protein KCP77_14165 [Salmonella enterica subsp. enterica]|nr:hypothetical protein KCP77_14165 [Salmonella enterica subsp. enterica]
MRKQLLYLREILSSCFNGTGRAEKHGVKYRAALRRFNNALTDAAKRTRFAGGAYRLTLRKPSPNMRLA